MARFRAIAAGSWGDAFEKHFAVCETSGLRVRCGIGYVHAIAVSAVTDIANKHFADAGLWEHVVATYAEIETYNETIKSIFHSIAAEIADAWAAHFGIEI